MDDDIEPISEPRSGEYHPIAAIAALAASGSGDVRIDLPAERSIGRVRRKQRTLTLTPSRGDVPPMCPGAQSREAVAFAESDEELIVGAAGGNAKALAHLYDRYAPALLSAGERILGGRRDAEDLLHDVFVEVWQQAGDYSAERGSVKSWLFLRMRSRAIDRLRLASRKNVELGEQVLATATREPTEDPALAPDRAHVRTTLACLPQEQRVAIELAYFGGLSGAQIAAQLGVPLGTVKTRLALGMSKLRAAFGEGKEVAK
jgi:RNA polymerase sigma-70 factor (ECF subfamily)